MSSDAPLLDIIQNNRAKLHWKLHLLPDRLVLYSSDGASDRQVLRNDAPEKVRLVEFASTPTALVVKTDKTHTFKLTPDVAAAVRNWIGPLTTEHLRVALKRRLWMAISTGILLLTMSLPRSHSHSLAFDPVFFFLGILLLGSAFFSVVRPHRISFIIDSSCLLLVATLWGCQIALGDRSWLWAIGVTGNAFLSLAGFFEFRSFRSMESRAFQPSAEPGS